LLLTSLCEWWVVDRASLRTCLVRARLQLSPGSPLYATLRAALPTRDAGLCRGCRDALLPGKILAFYKNNQSTHRGGMPKLKKFAGAGFNVPIAVVESVKCHVQREDRWQGQPAR